MITIERVQVSEGFLDGLDLTFSSGMNVLIGPRGAGKTSVIELIRFCLRVDSHTDVSNTRARKHALAVLGSGQVTVTVSYDGMSAAISRSAIDDREVADPYFPSILVFSQSEIEAVGLSPGGRLKIIDRFRPNPNLSDDAGPLRAQIRSLTTEAKTIQDELDSIYDQVRSMSSVAKELEDARAKEAELSASLATMPEQTEMQELGSKAAAASVRQKVFLRAKATVEDLLQKTRAFSTDHLILDNWPESAGEKDELLEARKILREAQNQLIKARALLVEAVTAIIDADTRNEDIRQAIDRRSRELRRVLDELKSGSGAATKLVADLTERAGQLSALEAVRADRIARLADVLIDRGVALETLERMQKLRFAERSEVASRLNSELGPRIHIALERGGIRQEYEDAISAALRGSGLHYNSLAPAIASAVSPRELVHLVDSRDIESLAQLVNVTDDRAARIISELASRGVASILTSGIDDLVEMSLLDGTEYKTTENLSTGQRCTIILPVLLGNHGHVLIVDQPEDNLDNAFIVDTLIAAIRKRGVDGQLIFSTHNANIPVLGEASRVVLMGSDGRRGFVSHAGNLEDARIVEAISSVMEGGREAFRRRARFYEERLSGADG